MKTIEEFVAYKLGNVESKNVLGGGDEDDDSAGGWRTGEGGYLQPGEGGPNDFVRNGYYDFN
jgi:hypothetical protein